MLPINLREEWLSLPEGDYPARTILGFPNSKQKQSGGLGLYYICGDRVLATYSPASGDKMLDRKGYGLENWPLAYKVIDPKKRIKLLYKERPKHSWQNRKIKVAFGQQTLIKKKLRRNKSYLRKTVHWVILFYYSQLFFFTFFFHILLF